MTCYRTTVQRSAKRGSSGLVNFIAAVAYHFCLALPTEFTQPGDQLLAAPCKSFWDGTSTVMANDGVTRIVCLTIILKGDLDQNITKPPSLNPSP